MIDVYEVDPPVKIVPQVHQQSAKVKQVGPPHKAAGDVDIAVWTVIASGYRTDHANELYACGAGMFPVTAEDFQSLL